MQTRSQQDGIIFVDVTTRKIVRVSPAVESVLRLSSDHLIGKELWEAGVLPEKEFANSVLKKTVSEGFVRIDDYVFCSGDGHVAYLEFVFVAVVDSAAPVIRIQVRDLTFQRRAEQEALQVLDSARCLLWQAEVVEKAGEYRWSPEIRNPDAAQRFLRLEVAPGKSLWDSFLDARLQEETEKQDRISREALASGRSGYQQEFRLRKGCGDVAWLYEDVHIEVVDAGRWQLTGVCTDITERKRIEHELRETIDRLELVSEATNDAVWDWEIGGSLHWTRGLEDLFGYCRGEIEPGIEGWTKRIHPDDLNRVQASVHAAIEGDGDQWQDEYRFIRKDGSVAYVLDRGYCLRDENGKATRMVGAMMDITERKQAEVALRESEAGYRSMFIANPHPMWVFDVDTLDFLAVNAAAVAHYGYSEQEFLSMKITDIRPAEDVERMLAVRSTRASAERKEGMWRHRVKSGEIIYVEIASHPLYWEGVAARVVLANDVTERKLVEDRLLAAQAELESRVHDRTAEVRRANVALQNEIAERRQAEEELRLSEARYRAIVEDQTEMICRFLDDGTFTFVNDAHCRYFQQAAQDLLGTSFFRFLSPEDAAATKSRLEKLSAENPVATYEHEMVLPTGEIRWQQWTDRYLVDENGAFVSYQAVGRDITERKLVEIELQRAKDEAEKANEELTRNEARLLNGNTIFTDLTRMWVTSREELDEALVQITEAGSLLLDVARCSIWLYSDDQSHIECVDLFERQTNRHSAGTVLSVQDFPNYFSHLDTRHSIVAHDAHTHQATYEFSEVYLKPLGISSMLDVPIIIGGRMVGVLCCEHIGEPRRWHVEDQTMASSASSICSVAIESYERARAEEALREARDEAEAARAEAESANNAKSEFLSRMSHELRTPLNAILGFSQILEQHDLNAMQRESVQFVLKGGRHLLQLINEVLDISRVESGRLELSLEPVDLASLVPEATALVRPLADDRAIRIELQMAGLAHHVTADHQRLRQIIFNLLSNAIKYNRPAGRVDISGEVVGGDRFRLLVRDTGYGINEKDLRKLFTPFERLQATSSEVEGTGLGLTVSQRLVSAMGGVLSVESVEGEGSTFTVELPLAQSPITTATETATSPVYLAEDVPSNRRRTILYIEDNSSNLRLLEVFFQSRAGEQLMSAKDGATGLQMAREVEPDLILLDLHLPEMPGAEVLNRLQRSALTRDIPVVIISADATPAQIERSLDTGARAFLTKPLDLMRLSETLDEVLYED